MLHRDFVAIVPALNCGVAGVAQHPSHFAYATKATDYVRMGFHMPNVRSQRTSVNVENGQAFRDPQRMADDTIGDHLIALKARSRMSLDKIAKAMGLAGRSSVQRFFVHHLERIEIGDALKLADVFAGQGSPPISREEVMALAKLPRLFEVEPNNELAPKYMDLPEDVPVYGTAMGTFREASDDSPAVEQAFIDQSEILDNLPRPPGYLTKTGIYGLYVQGESMEPRWDQGDPLYVDPRKPPSIGDDVVVYLMRSVGDENELAAVLIKRLVRRSASYLELRQYNPDTTFTVETRLIKAVHRVIPRRELLTVR